MDALFWGGEGLLRIDDEHPRPRVLINRGLLTCKIQEFGQSTQLKEPMDLVYLPCKSLACDPDDFN
jgi:hypothetical protein